METFELSHERATKSTQAGSVNLPIALVFSFNRNYCAGVLRGIGRYARGCENWALVSLFPHSRLAESIRAIKPAGIIVGDFRPEIPVADILRKTGRPVVDVTLMDNRFHQVTFDDISVGATAANHLLECGLKSFGYFGPEWGGLACEREGGFRQVMQRLSHKVEVCYVRPPGTNPIGGTFESQKHVCSWIRRLPKPAGVFAPSDTWALWLCGVCKQEGIKVPEDIAIVSANNDELLCELAQPSISSVAIPAERIGYEAAALLDRLLSHEPVPNTPLLLPSPGVVTRQSTDILAVREPSLITAIEYMRKNLSEPITIADVVRHACLSRRSFELKFRKALGRSPAQEIRRLRVEKSKVLLTNDVLMKMPSLAQRCGFAHTAQFFKAFHQVTGMTPTDYRRTMGFERNQEGPSVGPVVLFPK
jgi:LacI family transcriptional regulator